MLVIYRAVAKQSGSLLWGKVVILFSKQFITHLVLPIFYLCYRFLGSQQYLHYLRQLLALCIFSLNQGTDTTFHYLCNLFLRVSIHSIDFSINWVALSRTARLQCQIPRAQPFSRKVCHIAEICQETWWIPCIQPQQMDHEHCVALVYKLATLTYYWHPDPLIYMVALNDRWNISRHSLRIGRCKVTHTNLQCSWIGIKLTVTQSGKFTRK